MKMPRQLSLEEQKQQAQRCPCGGADEYCICQNMPDRETRRLWTAEEIVKVLCNVD